MQRHAAPAYAFCAQPLAPVSCIQSEKPAPLHAMLSCCGGGDGGGGGEGGGGRGGGGRREDGATRRDCRELAAVASGPVLSRDFACFRREFALISP